MPAFTSEGVIASYQVSTVCTLVEFVLCV